MTAAEIADRRGVGVEDLRKQLKGDLDNILGKALRRNPDERYATAEDLRADLGRYRDSLPVLARPTTVRYRVRKFMRRHRAGTLAGAAAAVAVVVGVAGVAWQASTKAVSTANSTTRSAHLSRKW
jgi:serine/threonine-protein kinase